MLKQELHRRKIKAALARVIAPYAYWSYAPIDPFEISDENLIEAVLIHGNDPLKYRLFKLFSKQKIRRVWEQKLIIQDSRLHGLNRKIATEWFHLRNPEHHIQQAYKKYNLYDRFSA
ncbi:MAG: hypothetical protein ACOYXT_23345 [Bacteroidota bacterium]